MCNNNVLFKTVIILAQTYVFGVGCCHYLCTMIVLVTNSQVVVFIEVSPIKLEPKPMSNCFFPCRKCGVMRRIPFRANQLAQVHPRSAIIASPGYMRSRHLHWLVKSLSLIEPSCKGLITVGMPLGEIRQPNLCVSCSPCSDCTLRTESPNPMVSLIEFLCSQRLLARLVHGLDTARHMLLALASGKPYVNGHQNCT